MMFVGKLKEKLLLLASVCLFCVGQQVLADGSPSGSIGAVAKRFTGMMESFQNLIITVSWVSSFGFMIAAVFKLKQHKENPQNVPIGTVFALFLVAVLLMNLPLLLVPTVRSIFGAKYQFQQSTVNF
jgi:hypothetical protein